MQLFYKIKNMKTMLIVGCIKSETFVVYSYVANHPVFYVSQCTNSLVNTISPF